MSQILLVRYGVIPEVARFAHDLPESSRPTRTRCHLQPSRTRAGNDARIAAIGRRNFRPVSADDEAGAEDPAYRVLRRATPEDEEHYVPACDVTPTKPFLRGSSESRTGNWTSNCSTSSGRSTVRSWSCTFWEVAASETTKLALQAAAAGLAVVEVQPVNADGPVPWRCWRRLRLGGCGRGLRQPEWAIRVTGHKQHGVSIHERTDF